MNPNVYISAVQKDMSLIDIEKVVIVGINTGILLSINRIKKFM